MKQHRRVLDVPEYFEHFKTNSFFRLILIFLFTVMFIFATGAESL
jgi:hypothetical protein